LETFTSTLHQIKSSVPKPLVAGEVELHLLDQLDHREQQEQLVHKEQQELMEHKDLQVQLVPLDLKDLLVRQVLQEQMVDRY
jgi:hypothetical protein